MDLRKRISRVIIALCGLLVLCMAVCYRFTCDGLHTLIYNGNGSNSENEENQEKYDHIVMTYQTMSGSRIERLDQVVEAVNEISRKEIGVEIELKLVDASESATEYPLWITQGKQMDLMVINYQDITNYVEHAMIQPLDDLLVSEGAEINAISEEYGSLYSGTTMDGQIYGVSIPADTKGSCGGLWIPKRYLDEIGFIYDENQIYSMDELDSLFSKLKIKYPDAYPLGQITTQYNFTTSSFFMDKKFEPLGSSVLSGGYYIDADSTVLVNFFETGEYYTWLTYMRKWYLNGYIYPDAAVTAETPFDLVKAGITMSVPQIGRPFLITEDLMGEPVVCLRLSQITYGKDSTTGIFWTIPSTSKNPAAAMKFLNLMYSSAEITNLFQWGVEGTDYVKQEDGSVTLPEGKSASNAGYFNLLGIYGDQRQAYTLNSNEVKAKKQEFANQAIPIGLEYTGFNFDNSSVGTEMNQVQKVLDRYLDVLETGSVDLDTIYPDFIQELHDAGIDTIIAEKQRQLDKWLAEKKE